MSTVNRTALSNLKQNKGKNMLTGIAIFLTTILIFVIPTVGLGTVDTQMAAINKYYPTFHAMFRDVDLKTIEELSYRGEIETMGLRQDPAQIPVPDGTGMMVYMDDTALKLGKMELEAGEFPKRGNEIAVSQGLLEALGITAGIGDTITLPYQPIEQGGLGYEEKGEFQITGLLPTSEEQKEAKMYSTLVSKEFMEQEQPGDSRKYRVMFRIQGADSMTRDQIENAYGKVAAELGIPEGDIADNSSYLMANYVDPAFYSGIVGILLVVVLAGIMTIYSIYYISMIYKVQEYGKIKALGATKRQIRQIVFREGMLVACIAVPVGLLAGSIASKLGFKYLLHAFGEGDALGNITRQLIESNEVVILKPWIYLAAAGIALATVALSLIRPMHIAAKISPVEAMRYDGSIKTRKKKRKGHEEMNLIHLTGANLSRNKKRSAITIITLSLTGILFMVIATVLSCADPKEIAQASMFDEFVLSVDSSSGDKMHPEKEWSVISQNNPLNEELENHIMSIPGVEQITRSSSTDAELKDLMDGDEYWQTGIVGIPETYAREMEKSIIEGSCTYEDLLQGDKIVMDQSMWHWAPEFRTGDTVHMILEAGDKTVEKEFTIAAVADMPNGLNHYNSFVLPKAVLDDICGLSMDYYWSIAAGDKEVKAVEEQLRAVTEEDQNLKMRTFEEELAERTKNAGFTSQLCYVFMAVLGGVGIMNLINTMINSIYVRRRELEIMQAIGLSERQLVRMLQMEGAFYTAGTLILSLGLGNLLGYLTFLYAKKDGLLGIISYHYPAVQTIVLIAVVLVIQLLLTYLIMKNFRRQSMIERIRFSE